MDANFSKSTSTSTSAVVHQGGGHSSSSLDAAAPVHAQRQRQILALRTSLSSITIPEHDERFRYRNWARSYTSIPTLAFQPSTEEDCVQILALARLEGNIVRAVGSGHSPSDLPCTKGYMIRMNKLDKIIEIDNEKELVVVQAGITLQALHPQLAARGLSMSIVGSISDSTLGGIISTGTHGSGLNHPCLSAYVLALDILLANGTRIRCSRNENSELFLASLCGLGATGLILRVTLKVEKAFRLKEHRVGMHIDEVLENLFDIAKGGEFVRLWWSPQTNIVNVMTANRTLEPSHDPSSWFWDVLIAGRFVEFLLFIGLVIPIFEYWGNYLRSIIGTPSPSLSLSSSSSSSYPSSSFKSNSYSASYSPPSSSSHLSPAYTRKKSSIFTPPWSNPSRTLFIDRSDKVFNVDCGSKQYTTEWCLPLSDAPSALREIRDWFAREYEEKSFFFSGEGRPAVASVPVEIRFSAADDIWLSPGEGRVNCWIGILRYKPYAFPTPFTQLSTPFERILRAHNGRPHWAKTHSFSPISLRALYPRFDDFLQVVKGADEFGLFANEYVRRHLFGEEMDVGHSVFAGDT